MNETAILINNIGLSLLNFYNSGFFSFIKFLLGIYAVVILADIVLLLIQRGLGGDVRETLLGLNVPPEMITKKRKLRKKWDEIRSRLKAGKESDLKIAIIKADEIIDDLIKRMGYPGENMSERLEGIIPGEISNISELKIAHQFRNKIIQEDGLRVEKKQAEEIIGYYENFLKFFEIL